MDDATSQSKAEAELEPGSVRWRQEFHRFPEAGFNERQTADCVTTVLQMLGVRCATRD